MEKKVLYVRCTNYRLAKCPCRGKLVGGQIIQTSIEKHTCSDSSETAQVRNLKHQMKVRAEDLHLNLVDIYNDVLHNVPEEIASQIPYPEIQPAMAYVRRKRWPTNLQTVEDVIHYYESGGTAEDNIPQDYYQGYEQCTDEGTLVNRHGQSGSYYLMIYSNLIRCKSYTHRFTSPLRCTVGT